MKNATCTYDDLYQEGLLGLTHGIRKFDVTRGVRLSTYVYRWIQAYVKRYYLNNYRTVRLPVHVIQQNSALNKQIEQQRPHLDAHPHLKRCVICGTLTVLLFLVHLVTNSLAGDDGELGDFVGVDQTQDKDNDLMFTSHSQLKGMVSDGTISL